VSTPIAAPVTPTATASPAPAKKPRVRATLTSVDRREEARYRVALRTFLHRDPSPGDVKRMRGLALTYRTQTAGSRKRKAALMKIQREAFGRPRSLPPVPTGPPKGLPAPTAPPVATPTPSPTPTAAPR
jgi:hypothetical protein